MSVDYEKLIEHAQAQGWHVETNAKNHQKLTSPKGEVVIAAPSQDPRAVLNLRAELRRHGLSAPHQMNDSRQHSAPPVGDPPAEAQPSVHLRRGELLAALREVFKAHPEHIFTMEELMLRVQVRIPAAKRESAQQAVYTLMSKGEVRRRDYGQYVYVDPLPSPPATADFTSGGMALGTSTGDPELDEDARILDEALAALGRVETRVRTAVEQVVQEALEPLARLESVVRRNREALAHIARLRATLKLM